MLLCCSRVEVKTQARWMAGRDARKHRWGLGGLENRSACSSICDKRLPYFALFSNRAKMPCILVLFPLVVTVGRSLGIVGPPLCGVFLVPECSRNLPVVLQSIPFFYPRLIPESRNCTDEILCRFSSDCMVSTWFIHGEYILVRVYFCMVIL